MSDILQVGDRSPRVAEVRIALAKLGHLPTDATVTKDSFTEADLLFDETLADALRSFQQSRGIIASGAINDATLRVIREASYRLGSRVLQYHPGNLMVGDDVAQLQSQLQELGFYPDRLDGRFGEQTHAALMNYQMNYGLRTDGICGPETIRAFGRLGRRITGGNPHALRERERMRESGPQLAGKRVVVDPALGGSNRGQSVNGPYGQITEEEIIWDLATRVEGRMIAAGVETILSRTRQDDPSYADRANMANAFGADLMISLQADQYHNQKANGVASFYFGSESGQSSITGELLSGFIQREIAARTALNNCGAHGRTWDLLRITEMPTVEVVVGYLTNPGDVSILTDPKARDAIAEAIVVAVKRLYLLDEDTHTTGTYKFDELVKHETS
ncbi:N-acetylmuramoyl-L-alanine amidase [Corynebacterium sp. 153RC1]|uniref:N-acetylmuramoyl-L-alanine amidase n=1 Tax=unclassified Corynebacterium TaxID=2624378 RepID=UPI00211C7784|nr:N-acetylmuramoyl-L-alanine amidase [Corynebacterium sp. 209RC1]MCQ9354947.1 N-acetylmuramoyl-L-alanine amidase [Corynebacterium sp. 1222RC1]MCQ9357208.1 N-acetylmuramoyl-L-alanine amidase [Corynebacterium sp. 122RC1]MCQ9359383.1 N-acetylmuramoyl-L-alanine amidase [Corynebacterium sp. 142RC1]MCQ9361605.1 N-acetylmuramoyl-L-alanine amidase [Corynebacterium sp. 153RC1]MCQ9363730.1 N-acetylmuramoyl-L-alanine amidase [Corynebacterium sp. 732RC1]MCQ9365520.1 N-acetylmuramoyl-L-alanine amidase [C